MKRIVGKQRRSAIGLDLGARRVKAVQLEAAPDAAKGWRVAAAACVNRAAPGTPFDHTELARITDTLDRLCFVGNRVVLAAPSDKLITGMLELPRTGQISLEQIARVELARTSKISPDAFEMGCWELPAQAKATKAAHVMAVGYAHAEAAKLLDLVESAGLDVAAVDVRPCALARACAGVIAPPPGITALLDLGWSSSSVVLVHMGMVVYVRDLCEAGMNRVYDDLAARLKLEPELVDYLFSEVGLREAAESRDGPALPSEARGILSNYADGLVRDLLASFAYVARQYTDSSVSRLLLTGSGATVPGLAEHLTRELGQETTAVAPKDLIECAPAFLEVCSSPELTPAIGLAEFPDT